MGYQVYGVPKILTFAEPGRPEISSLMSLRGPHHATYKVITFPKPWAWAARNLSNPWRGIWHTGYMGHWVSGVRKILIFAKPGRPEISSLMSLRGPHHATYKVTFHKPWAWAEIFQIPGEVYGIPGIWGTGYLGYIKSVFLLSQGGQKSHLS